MSLIKSAFTVGSLTMVSRLLGFVRDMFIASKLGAGPLSDVFFIAFKLPNFFRHLFAEGAFNAAFVPLYSGIVTEKGAVSAKDFAEKIAAVLFFALLIITILMQIFMPWVMLALAPGFSGDAAKFDLAVLLTRITFPYLLFMSLVSLLGGMLNSVGRFAAAALAPALLNICLILAAVYFTRFTPTPAHALSIGVTVAGLVQLIWLILATKRAGISLSFRLPRLNPQVKLLLKRMLPGVVGAGVTQLNLWIDTILATLIPSAVSYLYYADRISQFPLAVIGTAMGTALLPLLSRQIREQKLDESIATQNRALETALLFTLPAAIALIVLAVPIISVLFQRGAFGMEETLSTSYALTALACGLPAFVMIKVFTPGFFANGDTRTPVRIAIICLITNTVLNLILIKPFGYVGLTIATVVASWLNVILLSTKLVQRNIFKIDAQLKKRLPRIIFASLLMGGILWFAHDYSIPYFEERTLIRILALSILITIGITVFFTCAHYLKACDLSVLRRKKA